MKCTKKNMTILLPIIALLPLTTISLLFWSHITVNIRLPIHIWPKEYNLTIQISIEEHRNSDGSYTFSGDVRIRVQSLIATSNVIMHSKNLNYTSIEYWAENTPLKKWQIKRFHFEDHTDRMTLRLSEQSFEPAHNYILHFKYEGEIRNVSAGVFYREYQDTANNQTRRMVATQFQPADARRAFPCFDEPQFKAIFRVVIQRPLNVQSYSNGKRLCTSIRKDYAIDTFESSPEMPTYALAFIVAPFAERSIDSIHVISRPAKISQTTLALKLGLKILNVLGEYFNMTYYDLGIDKMTLVPVPNIKFGGMENWGLVTISESALENDDEKREEIGNKALIILLGHELAHMWFGNLVTCNWWTSLWLNEGFATFFSYFILEKLDLNITNFEELFFQNVIRSSFSYDVGDSLALHTERDEVSRKYFYVLNYVKSATIVHMTMHILGERNFQDSIQKYLQTNKFQTVTTDDFVSAVREFWPVEFEKHIVGFFKSMVEKSGYPLITINLFENGTGFEVIQERSPSSSNYDENIDLHVIYTVPISFTTNLDADFMTTSPDFFLSTARETYNFKSSSPAKWMISNIQGAYYFRATYNDENWLNIANALRAYNWSGIPILNRAKIIDDIGHLFCVDKISPGLALEILQYLSTETSCLPWSIALTHFEAILRHSKLNQSEIKDFMMKLLDRPYNELGFSKVQLNDSSNWLTQRKCNFIIPLACKYGIPKCLAEAQHYFAERQKILDLPKELRGLVYCSGVREGDESTYEEVLRMYSSNEDKEIRNLLMQALGCSKDPVVVEKHFWNIINSIPEDEKLKSLESSYSESDANAFRIYKLIVLNYKIVSDALGDEMRAMQIISRICRRFTSNAQKNELKDFSKSNAIQSDRAKKLLEKDIEALERGYKCF